MGEGLGGGGTRGWGEGPPTLPPHPMAIMSVLSLSSLPPPRWRRDVTSSGGMAVPTFHVTTVILGGGGARVGGVTAGRHSLILNLPPTGLFLERETEAGVGGSPQEDPQWARTPPSRLSRGEMD